MRICFISLGTFSHIDPYLAYFKQAGHDVHLLTLSPGPQRQVPTHNVGFGGKYTVSSGKWKYPFSMLRARSLLGKIRPDIVSAHYATSAGLTALVCGFHPSVITVHGSDLIVGNKSRLWRPVLKRIFQHADCVNVVSQELGDNVEKLGIDARKIEVLSPGIDTQKFSFTERNWQQAAGFVRMVCTRRLENVFDHGTIIKALAILKDKSVRFRMTFIADGSQADKLKQQIRDLNLDDSVDFTGQVPNEQIPQLLAAADVYLSASLWDGASLSLFEAMAAGLFPIVSNIKANSAWIVDGVNGLLHTTGEPDSLADCLLRFLTNPGLASSACLKNRETVVQKADRNKNMKLLESIYTRLKMQDSRLRTHESIF
jgi:L-malate glycosyltransferase